MINITLPDGTIKRIAKNSTAMDVAKSISEGFARNVISVEAQIRLDTQLRPRGHHQGEADHGSGGLASDEQPFGRSHAGSRKHHVRRSGWRNQTAIC